MSLSIALIWAMARNRVIGRDNDLPWHLPKDLKYFMRTTVGYPVIMGRRTFESMQAPLPRRTNIVVTRNREYAPAGAKVAPDLATAIEIATEQCRVDGKDTIFIAGGAEIYRRGLEIATHLHVTEIDAEFEGDTFFPEVDWSAWRRVSREDVAVDAEHAWPFSISVWERSPDRDREIAPTGVPIPPPARSNSRRKAAPASSPSAALPPSARARSRRSASRSRPTAAARG